MQQPIPQPTLREFDFGYYITHYTQLLWRWKLYILIAAPLATAGFALYLLNFGAMKPELEAAVMIGLEDSQTKTAVQDLGESSQINRLALLKASGFLSGIVDKLSLRFKIKEFNYSDIFDFASVDSAAPNAKYLFKIDENSFYVYGWSRNLGYSEKLIENGTIAKLDTLKLPGVILVFSQKFLKAPFTFECGVIRQRDAVAWLKSHIVVYDKVLMGRKVQNENFVGVALTGKDYKRITEIINVIAEEFVDKSLGFKKRKTQEAISVLEKQLAAAAEQVTITQDAVRFFRNEHPNIALAAELQNSIGNMALLESSMYTSRTSSEEARNLQTQLAASNENDLELLMNEALLFLSREGNIAASVLQNEYNQLIQHKMTLTANYAKTHPQISENRNKIAIIKSKTLSLLNEHVKNTANTTYQQSSKIQEITRRMQGLPVQQQQLAELERKSQVASEIHSSILSRFNQAKISDAVEVPDVFIMDYAIEPEPPSDLQNMLKLFGIGLVAILVFSFGPPVAYDFFDKTVRTESELVKLLPFTFLEAIPVIPTAHKEVKPQKKKQKNHPAPVTRLIDPKLVTASYTPDFTNELFRSLRSKIMLRLHDVEKKRVLVTSMGMNEGKSLITANLSITMAQQKLKTILIDGDIRRGVQHNTFVLQKKPGLSDFLFSEDAVTTESISELIQPTHVPNLSLIASGPNVPNPSELLGLPRLETLINMLSTMYDVVILDTPPIGASVDAAIVNKMFNGAILVVKAGSTNVIALKKRLKEFPNLQQQVLGMVLNQSMLDSSMKKYKYYSYLY